MKIRNKLFLLVVFFIVVFAASTTLMIFFVQKVKIGSPLYEEIRGHEYVLRRVSLLKSDMNQVRAALLTLLDIQGASDREQLTAQIRGLTATINGNFKELLQRIKEKDVRVRISSAQDAWQDFRDTRDQDIIPLLYSGDRARAKEIALTIQKARYEKFVTLATEVVEATRRRIDDIEHRVALVIQRSVEIFMFRGAVFLLFVFVFVIFLSRSVTRPIRRLMEAANKVASGDFTAKAEVFGRDEIGELANTFNRMTGDLSRLVEDERKLAVASASLAAERAKSEELEKAYLELTRTQQKYKDLVDNLNVGVYRNALDPEGRFLEVNPAMLLMFEAASADELLALRLSDLFRDKAKGGEFSEKLLRSTFVKGDEVELVTLKGGVFWASLTAVFKKNGVSSSVYGIIQDISEHKRMEFRLNEERERLKKIADSLGAGLCLIDREFRIVWINESMEKWFGAAEQVQGNLCYSTYQFRDEICDSCPLDEVFTTGRSQSSEKRIFLSDGRVMDFLFVCSPFRNEKGEVYQALELILDITERKRMVELLEYERALSKNVIDSIGDTLMVIDCRTKKILDVNREFLEGTGILKKEDIVGKTCEEAKTHLCPPCEACRFDEVVREGCTIHAMHVHEDAAGTPVYVDVTLSPLKDEKGRILGVIHLARNVTERKKLEDELQRYSENLESLVKERSRALQISELMFRKLFESAHDGILIIDYGTGRIIDGNPAVLNLLECPREECVGADARRLSCFSDHGFFENIHAKLAQKIFASYDGLPMRTMTGKEIFVEVRASLYFVEEKKIFECHIRDVTERMRMEKVKAEFVSMVSHELRTPLSAIKEGVEIVADGTQGKLNSPQQECLGIALSNVNRLNRLVGDILDISKIQSNLLRLNSVSLSVYDIVDQICGLVKIEIEKRGMVLMTNIEKNLPFILADKDRLIQILFNLLNNAIKFTRERSHIGLSCQRSGDFAEFAISDEGAGIPSADLSRLFGKFVQLDSTLIRRVGGTGLGLYISRNLVEAMGGRIWAESKIGEGSVFRFTVPLVKGHA